jgi:hypothetical protein
MKSNYLAITTLSFLAAAFFSFSFTGKAGGNIAGESSTNLGPTPSPTRKPPSGGVKGCPKCTPPGRFLPGKPFVFNLRESSKEEPLFTAMGERNNEDTKTAISVSTGNLNESGKYYLYAIDKDGKAYKLADIDSEKTTATTDLKSFMLAISSENNIQEANSGKFLYINEPPESFTKLRKMLNAASCAGC